MKQFTVQDGLEVQQEQLQEWKLKLNAECFGALEAFLLEANKNLTKDNTGGDVIRGIALDEFILNWRA